VKNADVTIPFQKNIMKTPISIIVAAGIFISPLTCTAAYLIELTNGAKFTTTFYWKEKNQIKFYAFGGILGFEKDLISNITELPEIPYPLQSPPAPSKPLEDIEKMPSFKEIKKAATIPRAHPEKEAFIKEKRNIDEKIQAVCAALRKAKVKKDKKQVRVERKKLLSLKTELSNLRKRVSRAYGGQLPAWWDALEAPKP